MTKILVMVAVVCSEIIKILVTPASLTTLSGVARAFPGGRVANPEGQNEEENKENLREKEKLIEI